jgi:hypothetical protein
MICFKHAAPLGQLNVFVPQRLKLSKKRDNQWDLVYSKNEKRFFYKTGSHFVL